VKFLLHALLNRLNSPAQTDEFVTRSVKDLPVLADAPTNAGNKFCVVANAFRLQPQAVVKIVFEHPEFQIHRPFQSSRNGQQLAGFKGSPFLRSFQNRSYVAYATQWWGTKLFQPPFRVRSFLQPPLNFLKAGGWQKSLNEFLRQFSSASLLKGFLDFFKLKDAQSPFVHPSHLSLNLTPLRNKRNREIIDFGAKNEAGKIASTKILAQNALNRSSEVDADCVLKLLITPPASANMRASVHECKGGENGAEFNCRRGQAPTLHSFVISLLSHHSLIAIFPDLPICRPHDLPIILAWQKPRPPICPPTEVGV